MKEQIKKIQTFVNVSPDGDFGPKTTAAVANTLNCGPTIKEIQGSVGVIQDGELGPITLQAIITKLGIKIDTSKIDRLIAIASTQVGIHETSRNNGTGIEKYWGSTTYPDGYKNREPYCAAAQCWIAQQSQIFTEKERPKSASAFGWESWGDDCDLVKVTRSPRGVKRGDFVVFSFSHIGIATSNSDKYGNFNTIEANTGANGSRDGDGVYSKTRNISSVRSTIGVL